jgi:MYND finger
MVKLGDFYMLAVKMPDEQRDVGRACALYQRAAALGHPEGLVASAMVCLLNCFPPDEKRSTDFDDVVPPATQLTCEEYPQMWSLLEAAADLGHLCPFTVVRLEKVPVPSSGVACFHSINLSHRSFVPSFPTFHGMCSTKTRSTASRRRCVPSPFPFSTRLCLCLSPSPPLARSCVQVRFLYLRHRRDYRTLNLRRCNFCECPHNPANSSYRVMDCQKCRARRYCCRNCQVADWEAGHKKECKALLAWKEKRAATAAATAEAVATVEAAPAPASKA